MNFTKQPTIKQLAKLTNIPQEQASFVYDVLIDLFVKQIKAGNDLILPHIGTLRLIKGREMRSNLTGVTVPPHKRLRFTTNIALAKFIRISTRAFPIK